MTGSTLWVVDRFEDGRRAVLLSADGRERTVAVSDLPEKVAEGDAVREASGAYEVDTGATERLRREAKELRSSLRRGPSGPLDL